MGVKEQNQALEGSGIMELIRTNAEPPQRGESYTVLPFRESLERIGSSNLSEGAKKVLEGLLTFGGAMEFPGGLGLDYNAPFKKAYFPEYTKGAFKELSENIDFTRATGIIAPDISALLLVGDLSSAAGGKPVLRVQKDGKDKPYRYKFALNSYTKGGNDVLYFDDNALASMMEWIKINNQTELRVFLFDEIADTGRMLEGIYRTIEEMERDGIKIRVVGAGVLLEKTFTNSRSLIESLGIPLYSIAQIEDLWIPNPQGDYPAGIKVVGIEEGLAFRRQLAA